MSSMGFQPQYMGGQGPAFNTRIVRRPLTDAERELPGRFYKSLQNGLRGLSLFCLILFVFSTFVLPSMITDPVTYDSVSITLSIFMGVFGLVAIGMAVNTIATRSKISQAMADGTAVEVFAPAYRSNTRGKVQSWTIGPISMMQTRGMDGLLMDGQPTSILCLPKLKAAIAVNNCGLRQGARIMCPPNLEMMAVPEGIPYQAAGASQMTQPYPSYASQTVSQPSVTDEELPPPPPDWQG